MFLYELALELGVRSTALLDRAHALGIQVDQTTKLNADQVETLREAYGKGRGRPAPEQVIENPIAPTGASEGNALGLPAIVAMVIAGLVVVLLAGYVVSNSGGDETLAVGGSVETNEEGSTATTEPCDASVSGIGIDAIGREEAPDETDPAAAPDAAAAPDGGSGLPPCDVAGGLSGDEIAGPATTEVGDPIDRPRDKREFCKAAISAMEFEEKLYEAATMASLGQMRDVMIQGRDRWKSDVVIMTATAPPRIDVPLERYLAVYTNLLDSATPEADDMELAVRFTNALRTDLAYYATQITQAIGENCGHR